MPVNDRAPTVEQAIVACFEKVLAAFGSSFALMYFGPEWFYTDDDGRDPPPPVAPVPHDNRLH